MKHVHAELIKVWADDISVLVQCKASEDSGWRDLGCLDLLVWNPTFQYRIKPQPKAISWTNMYSNGGAGWSHRERLEAENEASDRGHRVGLVEVRDDGTAHLHKVEA